MRTLLFLALCLESAFGQVADIATNLDGSALVIQSRFRLQAEIDLRDEQKIYRWQNDEWTRLVVQPLDDGFIPGSISEPFVVGDGSVYGWWVFPPHGKFPPVPIRASSELHGIDIPGDFPTEQFNISPSGRFVAGVLVGVRAERLDFLSGERTELPLGAWLPKVADDGTIVCQLDEDLVVIPTHGAVREVLSGADVASLAISADAQWIGIETVVTDGTHQLSVASVSSGLTFPVTDLPTTSRPRGSWSLGGHRVVYIARDELGRLTRIKAWDTAGLTSYDLSRGPEPFAEVTLSADTAVVWAVTVTNRLWKIDVASGVHEEILPPLGFTDSPGHRTTGNFVPGSALLLRGSFTRSQQVYVANEAWPTSDVNSDGLWFQVPWEATGIHADPETANIIVRAPDHPFEEILAGHLSGEGFRQFSPYFPERTDSSAEHTVIAAHQDWRGVITSDDPARPGEIVQVYMTGLGPLDREVPTGQPGPLDPALPLHPVTCMRLVEGSTWLPLDVLFVGYAGGMIGFYQVNVVMPSDLSDELMPLRCFVKDRRADGHIYTSPH